MAYRNVYYDNNNEVIHLFTWDKDGNRTKVLCSYEPYLYLESQNGCDGKSIFNSTLKKVKFNNQRARNKFVQETPITRLFYNLGTDQQFLLDNFKNDVDKEDYGKQPLKIFYIDIETYSDGTGFSKASDADDPINLITIYDSLSEMFYTFGCKTYATLEKNVRYIKCTSERDLLTQFIKFWKKDYPDIVTGWNIDGYDIPYIINRISKIWDNEDKPKELSPVGRIQFRENVAVNKLGQQIDRWYIHGISILDYMEVYKTFAQGNRENYSLNYIGEYELGEGKVAVGSYSLSRLADEDWMKFVDYNIQDVRILVKLEETLKYLKLIRNLSYRGFVPFTKALAKVSVITGAVAHQALKDGYIIPTFTDEREKKKFAGGYVYEPKPGLYEDLVTYDANSLYPNTIITLNISPETKIGKILSFEDNKFQVLLTNQKTVSFTKENFKKFIDEQQLSITKANILYSQKAKGVVPKLIDKLYKERIAAKTKMLEAEKKLVKTTDENQKKVLEEEVVDNYTLQNVYKTLLNSIYGVFSNIYSPLFDIEHAESVTLTGQAVVKTGAKIVHEYAVGKGFDGNLHDICVYSDTDSVYFSFSKLFAKNGITLSNKDGEITPEANQLIKDIGADLNTKINEWAKAELKTIDPRYFFKREKICDVALLQAKKYYILHILDSEGVPTNEFLYKGIEIATSKISKEIKQMLKNVVESAILSKDRNKAGQLFQDSYEEFCKLPVDAIATRKKVNNYKKYEGMIQESGEVGKGTPGHTKAAIHFNTLLEKLNLTNKYHTIQTGTTIKVFYCKKNKYNYDVLAFGDEFPQEIQEYIKPDYKMMFEKNVMPVVTRIFEIIGWPTPAIGCQEHTDLIDLFSQDINDFLYEDETNIDN
jgi:DNA polymerase elongation subunit (family B)